MTTLDHLTQGRIGWNVVSGYLDSAAKGLGRDKQNAHDDRYEIAEDYMDVVYKLWEGSWADDAVIRDRKEGVFTDPQRVRKVSHQGPHYCLDALHLGEPSPQRTPVLYQAGSSPAGRAFAARHAECVFISGPPRKVIATRVAAIRKLAQENGRDPASLLIFALMTIVTAPSDADARAKFADYRRYASPEGALTLMSGWTGVDFSRLNPDQIVEHVESEAGRTALENVTRADPDRVWTVKEVANHVAIGGIGPVVVGSPEHVADDLETWVDETGIDGFNLAFAVRPETFQDIVDLVVPELQRRRRYKRDYDQGTLREKLFGQGRARLTDRHPAARFRWS
jgi:long-chain alkane monooxygenase